MMAEFQEPPVAKSVLRGVAGCCPYCHQRTKGTWRVRVEISPLWPHRITCPQCHQAWDSIAHFNQDAKRIVVKVLKEAPDRIEEMNATPEQQEWDTLMDDAIGTRKEKQDWQSIKMRGRPWSPYDGLLSDFEKRYWIHMGGFGDGKAEAADNQVGDGDGGGLRECDSPDSGELQADPGEPTETAGQDGNDN